MIGRRSMAAVALLLCAGMLPGQVTSTSTLSGTVSDTTGAVVVGAAVTVRNQATGAAYSVLTGANGTFSVPALGSGTYAVTVEAKGFKMARVPDIKMDVGVPTDVQVKLEVGAQTESVT